MAILKDVKLNPIIKEDKQSTNVSVHTKMSTKYVFTTLLIIVFLALIGSTFYFYRQYQILKQQNPATIQRMTQEEVKKVVNQVSKLMLLPNETPTLATITDINKLKDQLFFKKAANGDKILIYTTAKEAILYDPKLNIIVNVAPVIIGGDQPSQAGQAKIGLRNGTKTQGLASTIESQIQQAYPGANIVLKQQDQKTDYSSTIVIALNPLANAASSDLAKTLNAKVASLPSEESKPSGVDILVIIGSDKI